MKIEMLSGALQLLELHDVTTYKAIKSGAIFGQYIPSLNFRILNFAWLSFALFVSVGEVLVKRGNVSRFISDYL
ncbi:hypothetical protein I308_106263 [Cryptococcus tetragattii IND107]|uniref:Uncharacterized protein n=1 Tax=Cryptococcus tetragattii IND107 TaxID=1296105 RepID=A0ABR3BLZ9_9TREE